MINFKKISIVFIFLLAMVVAGAWYYIHGINEKNSEKLERLHFIINKGEGSEEISKKLQEAGLIKSSLLFNIYAWKVGYDAKLRPGEYDIPQNVNIKDIVQMLTAVKTRLQNKITIIEGWTIKDIAHYFEERGVASSIDFLKAVEKKQSWWDDFTVLKDRPKSVDLEGYLFPDTYLVYKDASINDIIKKMVANLEKKLTPEMRESIQGQGKTIHEILTLASIIEKEVSGDEDRAIVSGIFQKRLRLGIGLQADSTVNYVTGKKEIRPSLDDVSTDNPYNTYKYRGLPPGPICNPSISSIRAAIYPKESPYMYFLTTSDGKVIYSKTYDEHITAKQKYLK